MYFERSACVCAWVWVAGISWKIPQCTRFVHCILISYRRDIRYPYYWFVYAANAYTSNANAIEFEYTPKKYQANGSKTQDEHEGKQRTRNKQLMILSLQKNSNLFAKSNSSIQAIFRVHVRDFQVKNNTKITMLHYTNYISVYQEVAVAAAPPAAAIPKPFPENEHESRVSFWPTFVYSFIRLLIG